MKDSQDWLDEILFEAVESAAVYNKNISPEEADYIQQVAKSAIRKHILQEALEILKDEPEQGWEARNTPTEERNQLRQELRNKFNDKYKED